MDAGVAILFAVMFLALLLLGVLVGGLLRSHAEILRRLGDGHAVSHGSDGDRPVIPGDLSEPRPEGTQGFDVAGEGLDGGAMQFAVGGGVPTLFAFLSSGCQSCQAMWAALGEGPSIPSGARLIVVTKDPSRESPSRLRDLASDGVTVVMSARAWKDYRVPSSPYFIFVDGDGRVHSEGSARDLSQALSLLKDAIADSPPPSGGSSAGGLDPVAPTQRYESPTEQMRAEDALRAAGIEEGHPSLYEP